MALERLVDNLWGIRAVLTSVLTGKKTYVEKVVRPVVLTRYGKILVDFSDPTTLENNPRSEAFRTGKSVNVGNFGTRRIVTRRIALEEDQASDKS